MRVRSFANRGADTNAKPVREAGEHWTDCLVDPGGLVPNWLPVRHGVPAYALVERDMLRSIVLDRTVLVLGFNVKVSFLSACINDKDPPSGYRRASFRSRYLLLELHLITLTLGTRLGTIVPSALDSIYLHHTIDFYLSAL